MYLFKEDTIMMNNNNIKTVSAPKMFAGCYTIPADSSYEETNQFADPELANNGGGYSQPSIIHYDAIIDRNEKVVGWIISDYLDSSCGDFGTRKNHTVEIIDLNGKILFINSRHWGTMEGEPWDDENEFVSSIARFTGWNFYSIGSTLSFYRSK